MTLCCIESVAGRRSLNISRLLDRLGLSETSPPVAEVNQMMRTVNDYGAQMVKDPPGAAWLVCRADRD